MKPAPPSPRVAAAIDDLEAAAELLDASASEVARAAGGVCASLAKLWRLGWAPDPLPERDRAILRLAHAALAAAAKPAPIKTASARAEAQPEGKTR